MKLAITILVSTVTVLVGILTVGLVRFWHAWTTRHEWNEWLAELDHLHAENVNPNYVVNHFNHEPVNTYQDLIDSINWKAS